MCFVLENNRIKGGGKSMDKKETFWGELGKKVPMDKVYDDAFHPALSEVGRALKGTVRVCLAPISAMVWSYDKIADYLDEAIPKYFEKRKILKDKIVSPDPAIAVPAIEALRYANKDIIKEMFVNILGASMNIETANFVHPSFVEIIRQITPDEAKILKQLLRKGLCEPLVDVEIEKNNAEGRFVVYSNFGVIGYESNCEYPEKISLYVDNLKRLALVQIPENAFLIDEWRYEKIVNSTHYKDIVEKSKKEGEVFCVKRMIGLTDYGMRLREICLS